MTLKLRRIFLVGGVMMKIHQFGCETYFNIMEKMGRRQIQASTNGIRGADHIDLVHYSMIVTYLE